MAAHHRKPNFWDFGGNTAIRCVTKITLDMQHMSLKGQINCLLLFLLSSTSAATVLSSTLFSMAMAMAMAMAMVVVSLEQLRIENLEFQRIGKYNVINVEVNVSTSECTVDTWPIDITK